MVNTLLVAKQVDPLDCSSHAGSDLGLSRHDLMSVLRISHSDECVQELPRTLSVVHHNANSVLCNDHPPLDSFTRPAFRSRICSLPCNVHVGGWTACGVWSPPVAGSGTPDAVPLHARRTGQGGCGCIHEPDLGDAPAPRQGWTGYVSRWVHAAGRLHRLFGISEPYGALGQPAPWGPHTSAGLGWDGTAVQCVCSWAPPRRRSPRTAVAHLGGSPEAEGAPTPFHSAPLNSINGRRSNLARGARRGAGL